MQSKRNILILFLFVSCFSANPLKDKKVIIYWDLEDSIHMSERKALSKLFLKLFQEQCAHAEDVAFVPE